MKQIRCNKCGEFVSTPVPDDTIIRAWVECLKCITNEDLQTYDEKCLDCNDEYECYQCYATRTGQEY